MRKLLIVVAGFPGVGKTTLAYRLGQHYGFSVLSYDMVRWALHDSERGKQRLQGDDAGWLGHAVLTALCQANLRQGIPVILEAALGYPGLWELYWQVCEASAARMLALVLDCPYEISAVRVASRQNQPDDPHDLRPEDLAQHRFKLDHFRQLAYPHHRIDATLSPDAVFAQATQLIDAAWALPSPMP